MASVLIIEDEDTLRYTFGKALERAGLEVVGLPAIADARLVREGREFDAVVTDVNLSGADDGIDYVRELRAEGFEGPILVVTGYGTVESAVAAMKAGADDFLQKPVVLEELVRLVRRMLETRALRSRVKLYERLERVRGADAEILGDSEAWRRTLELSERLAALPISRPEGQSRGSALPTMLLLGETGTGKGLLARHIHECAERGAEGRRGPTPFVHINCTALPPSLVESELFGHEKGAFTDAKGAREGLFEMAEGGTIFLDEIGDMPLELQAKILTVVEQGVFRRVGGSRERRVSARLIAATNVDLAGRAETGAFRRDLYYRLNAFTVQIPRLRDRENDAVAIAEEMLRRFGREFGRGDLELGDEARRAILAHAWPGNVRELLNVVQRAALLCQTGVVSASDLGLGSVNDRQRAAHAFEYDESAGPAKLRFDFESGEHTAESVERELIIQARPALRLGVRLGGVRRER
ncbi:MAG: sigma-54-dependent Fis family transcriptional regulator [Phycisphaerales bacterium]|nr:sigma-54-dependent Fis family transcriptional regulator [Phycisphaerales bacterium]